MTYARPHQARVVTDCGRHAAVPGVQGPQGQGPLTPPVGCRPWRASGEPAGQPDAPATPACRPARPARDARVRARRRTCCSRALTHRSYAYENGGLPTNERLEFLGDAVLGLVVTDALYRRHPDLPEGQLAKLRAAVVNMRALAGRGPRPGPGRPRAARPRRGDQRRAGQVLDPRGHPRGAVRRRLPRARHRRRPRPRAPAGRPAAGVVGAARRRAGLEDQPAGADRDGRRSACPSTPSPRRAPTTRRLFHAVRDRPGTGAYGERAPGAARRRPSRPAAAGGVPAGCGPSWTPRRAASPTARDPPREPVRLTRTDT